MTITRTELPDGQWADLRDPADVVERLRRPIRAINMRLAKDPAFAGVVDKAKAGGIAALEDLGESDQVEMGMAMGPEAMELLEQLNDRLILSRVAGWSFDFEVSLDNLLELPGAAYDALKKICAEGALSGPDMSPSTEEDSPTVPSTGSA